MYKTPNKRLSIAEQTFLSIFALQFEVERRNEDTRIDICCATKPGLLLSSVTTLETLGLEIQQCVISCFNDFTMQASCSEVQIQFVAIWVNSSCVRLRSC